MLGIRVSPNVAVDQKGPQGALRAVPQVDRRRQVNFMLAPVPARLAATNALGSAGLAKGINQWRMES